MFDEEPTILRDEFVCKGRRVALYRRVVRWRNNIIEKDLVKFGKAVVIVPVLDDGRIVFVKQWRASVSSWVLEVPAGRVENNEDLKDAALRELREETGFVAEELTPLARAFVSPGYSDEVQTIFVAKKLRFVGAQPEAGEIINVVYMTPQEYLNSLNDNSIADLKSLAAILLYLNCSKSGKC
ncbi:MAG: NUDIX hydrolase [Ignisphaera sp.]